MLANLQKHTTTAPVREKLRAGRRMRPALRFLSAAVTPGGAPVLFTGAPHILFFFSEVFWKPSVVNGEARSLRRSRDEMTTWRGACCGAWTPEGARVDGGVVPALALSASPRMLVLLSRAAT
jgi:hypothetical protein